VAVVAGVGAGAAVGLALAAGRSRPTTELPSLDPGERFEVRTSDGASLTVDVTGPAGGPMVVLAHCWGGDVETWTPVAHRLVHRGHRVVRWYQRGHGPSTVGEHGFAIERFGADLAEVLEAVDAVDAVVAGHSLGGMTTQAFAIGHPEIVERRVRALVLVATASGGMARSPLAPVARRLFERPAADRALASRYGHVLTRGALGKGASPAAVRATRDHFVGTPRATRAGILDAMLAMDLREGRRAISVPTTVVVGTRDTLTPPGLSRGIAEAIPASQLVTLPGLGHMLPFEAPDVVADLIGAAAGSGR
jgi:pimeloyl-ACP methyl ester carboxylesterase